jgi:L-alanine-DL-glutamate epimerase-like enolase superfamily enzyme
MILVIVEPETAPVALPFNLEIVWQLLASQVSLNTLKIEASEEIFPLNHPFRISRGSRTEAQVVVVTITDGEHIGRGECVPIKRYKQTSESVLTQIESVKAVRDLDRTKLQQLLEPGAARNAMDCALWDLEAKRSGKRVWEMASVPFIDQVVTCVTISLDTPEKMSASAVAFVTDAERQRDGQTREGRSPDHPRRLESRRYLKLKLGGDEPDLARVEAVRAAAPKARLLIDANESWSPRHYQRIVPALSELGVELIEQPFPADADEVLETLDHRIPVCADESCHTSADLSRLKNRYEAINIKLDKTGGLTEALALYQRARENNFKILIGCMVCTSLSIAPARLLASNADWVDLDGPLLLAHDRDYGLRYQNGRIGMPTRELWG